MRRYGDIVALATAVSLLAGCAGQFPGSSSTLARENRDLRAMLKEAMRQVRQLEMEQERLRASVETLEYRQRLIAKHAGVEADTAVNAPHAGMAAGSAANGSPNTGDYGSQMPRVGLEGLRSNGAAKSTEQPFTRGSAPARPRTEESAKTMADHDAGAAVREAEARRRIRGQVVGRPPGEQARTGFGGPASGESGAATGEPERAGSRQARVLPPPSYLNRKPPQGDSATRSAEPSAAGGSQEELALPEVPPALQSSAYATAAEQIREGAYEDAVQNLRDFIHDNPSSAYADDAQYWIGEAYLRQGAYSKAIIEFNQVVVHYGSSDTSAKALLKQAEVFSLLGDDVDARFSLQKVVNNYAGSSEAARARALLEKDQDRASAAP